MVEHLDLEQLPGADEFACHADVRLARGWVPAGMIVCDHDG